MATPDLVGFVVSDMAQSLAFYRLLGLDIPPEADEEQHVEVTLPGGFRLAWDTISLVESFHGSWTAPQGNRMGMAFLCATPQEVDDLYQQVVAAGYESSKAPWDAFWGQRYAVVVDPDGNLIDLFANLPV